MMAVITECQRHLTEQGPSAERESWPPSNRWQASFDASKAERSAGWTLQVQHAAVRYLLRCCNSHTGGSRQVAGLKSPAAATWWSSSRPHALRVAQGGAIILRVCATGCVAVLRDLRWTRYTWQRAVISSPSARRKQQSHAVASDSDGEKPMHGEALCQQHPLSRAGDSCSPRCC